MTIYCPNCGTANKDFAEFCISCGEDLTIARKKERTKKMKDEHKQEQESKTKELYRSRSNKILTGLSAGLAEYLGLEVDLVRVLWIIAFIVSGGMVIVIYFIMAMFIPLEPLEGKKGKK
ncbi:MAG: PspC domain-containing protein [Asgard group archaeon]|nr:PspC domain-containing protein [Asgard group archaeon]